MACGKFIQDSKVCISIGNEENKLIEISDKTIKKLPMFGSFLY